MVQRYKGGDFRGHQNCHVCICRGDEDRVHVQYIASPTRYRGREQGTSNLNDTDVTRGLLFRLDSIAGSVVFTFLVGREEVVLEREPAASLFDHSTSSLDLRVQRLCLARHIDSTSVQASGAEDDQCKVLGSTSSVCKDTADRYLAARGHVDGRGFVIFKDFKGEDT